MTNRLWLYPQKETDRVIFAEDSPDRVGSRDRAWAEINLDNLRHNTKILQAALPAGCRIMAVVKANAYRHADIGPAPCP